jgi:hypothetical protein
MLEQSAASQSVGSVLDRKAVSILDLAEVDEGTWEKDVGAAAKDGWAFVVGYSANAAASPLFEEMLSIVVRKLVPQVTIPYKIFRISLDKHRGFVKRVLRNVGLWFFNADHAMLMITDEKKSYVIGDDAFSSRENLYATIKSALIALELKIEKPLQSQPEAEHLDKGNVLQNAPQPNEVPTPSGATLGNSAANKRDDVPKLGQPRKEWLYGAAVVVALMLGGPLIFGGSTATSTTDQIIKGSLRSPSSYSVKSQKVLWSGKSGSSKAYIVKTEFDAQNGFGANIRDCYYTSFSIEGNNVSWSPVWGLRKCSSDVGHFGYISVSESEFVKTLIEANNFSD